MRDDGVDGQVVVGFGHFAEPMKRVVFVVALSLASTGELAAQSTPTPSSPSSTAVPPTQVDVPGPIVGLDVPNFCCPEYITALRKSVAGNWQAPPGIAATTTIRFVIERDGQISKAEVEQPSGGTEADVLALRAVRLAKPGRLPSGFNQQTLTVHLTFATAPRGPAPSAGTSVEFDTQGVEFGPWIRRFIAQMQRNWFIPNAAMSQKGRTVVTFSVSKAGVIRDVKVIQPSGVAEFDRAAFNAVVGANPLEPLPPAHPRDEVQFTLTFYYNERPPAK